jgi:hypothetical protein
MLSEAKHLGLWDCVGSNVGSEIESLASQTSSAALQLRSAQNDSGLRIGHEKEAQSSSAL